MWKQLPLVGNHSDSPFFVDGRGHGGEGKSLLLWGDHGPW